MEAAGGSNVMAWGRGCLPPASAEGRTGWAVKIKGASPSMYALPELCAIAPCAVPHPSTPTHTCCVTWFFMASKSPEAMDSRMVAEPMLEVRMITVFLKLTTRPCGWGNPSN